MLKLWVLFTNTLHGYACPKGLMDGLQLILTRESIEVLELLFAI